MSILKIILIYMIHALNCYFNTDYEPRSMIVKTLSNRESGVTQTISK